MSRNDRVEREKKGQKSAAKTQTGAGAPTGREPRRLNTRALILMMMILGVSVPGVVALRYWQTSAQRSSLYRQAKQFKDQKDLARALTYVNRYLEQVPTSADALSLKAEILAATATTPEQSAAALEVNEQAIRALGSKATPAMRLRSVELNLRQRKYQTAVTQARDLLGEAANAKPGEDKPGDAKTHRLLALGLFMSDPMATDEKNSAEVIRHLELAVAADPSDIASSLDLASVYASRSALPKPEAIAKSNQVLDRVVLLHPKAVDVRLARYKLYADNEQYDKALADAREAVALEPNSVAARLALSEALRLTGDNQGAIAQIDSLPKQDQERPEVRLARGLAEMTSNKIDRAVEEWRQGLVKSGGNDAETTWRLAFVLLNLGRINDADPLIEQYKRLAGSAEATPEASMLDGLKALRQSRFDDAVTILESIRAKLSPALVPQANFVLGQCYQAKGNAVQASDSYRRAAKSSTRWATPWLALAEQAAATGNMESALNELTQGLTAMPGDPTLLLAQARLAWRIQLSKPALQRDYGMIEKLIRRLEETNPNHAQVVQFKAEYIAVRSNLQQALGALQDAAKKQPNNVSLWMSLSNAQVRSGKFLEAKATLDEIRKNVGDLAELRLAMSRLAIAQGDENLARNILAVGINSLQVADRSVIYRALGDLLLQQKDLAGANRAYESWRELNPTDPTPLLSLVQVALAGTSDQEIRRRVDALKGADPKDVYWRLARIQELLRVSSEQLTKPEKLEERLNEALAFANFIIESGTAQAQGLVLRAAVQERRGKIEETIADLRRAIDLEGGGAALRPLCQALAKVGRFDEIEQIRVKLQAVPVDIDQMIAEIAVQSGKPEIARKMADRIVESNAENLMVQVWYARVLGSLGQQVAAEESLRKYAERRGDEASPWLALLVYQSQKLNREGMEKTLNTIQEKVKSEKRDLLLGQAYDIAALPAQADEHFRQAMKQFPDDTRTTQTALEFYTRYNRKGEAEGILRYLYQRNPNLNWVKRRLALLLSERIGDEKAWKEAFALVATPAQGNDVEPVNDRMVRAIVLARGAEVQRRDAAIKELESLIPTLADTALPHEVLARIYADDQTKLVEAKQHAEAAVAQDPKSTLMTEFCVDLAMRTKDIPMAEKYMARLDVLEPGSLRVIKMRARLLAANGRARDGAKLMLQYIERLKAAAQLDAQRELGSVAQARDVLQFIILLGSYDEVEPSARRVTDLWPRLSHVLAPSLASLGRVDEALAMLKQGAEKGDWREASLTAVNMATTKPTREQIVRAADDLVAQTLQKLPNQTDVLQAQAFLKHFEKKYEDEIGIYERIRKINPNDARFLNNQAWTLAENLHKFDDAIKVIDDAIARSGRLPAFLDTRGVILTRMGKFKESVADLEAAREAATVISDGQPLAAIHFHLARAYMLDNQMEKAKTVFEEGKKLGLNDNQLEPTELDDYRKLTASR